MIRRAWFWIWPFMAVSSIGIALARAAENRAGWIDIALLCLTAAVAILVMAEAVRDSRRKS